MSEFNEFLKLIAEGKKTDPKAIKAAEIKEHIKSDLDGLFGELAEVKTSDPKVAKTKVIKENIKTDLGDLFSELAALKAKQEELIQELPEEVKQEEPVKETPEPIVEDKLASVNKYLTGKSYQQPVVDKTTADLKAITDKIKYLEQWVGKISAHGPGSGEVNLRYLDDVDRPTIYDMRYLRYNASKKKFEFAEVNPHDIVYTTVLVTTPTYTVTDEDYYVGVNYAGPTTITLPAAPSSGRMLIIKDESGNASTNPIAVEGTVDNDAGGFIIQLDNGAIQMIYRNGWRIV